MSAMTGMKKRKKADLLVEDAVALVDVRDITLVFVGPFPGELALLIDTRYGHVRTKPSGCEEWYVLLVDLADDAVNRVFARFVVRI